MPSRDFPAQSRHAVAALALLLLASILAACGSPGPHSSETPGGPSLGPAELQSATPNPITPEVAAEAFALNSTATDLQRDELTQRLVGSVVEWEIPVYEIDLEDDVYRITSQPFQIQSQEAIPLLRAVALLRATSDAERNALSAARTNDRLRIRASVREIRLRTVVLLAPAILVSTAVETPQDAPPTIPAESPQ